MSKFQKEVLKLAALIGDPKGKLEETVDYIACELQVSYDDVRRTLKEAA
jgi:hypothetical protein